MKRTVKRRRNRDGDGTARRATGRAFPVEAVAAAVLTILGGASSGGAEHFTTTVTYVTATMVYVDAGTDQGLEKGALLEFRRDGASIAELTVSNLSSKRAACRVEENHDIRVGDRVVFDAEPPEKTPETAAVAPEPTPLHFPATEKARQGRIPGIWRGRVGLRFMARADATEDGTDMYQPSLDARADVGHFTRPDLSLKLDVRTRRTFISSDTVERSNGRTRVHHASVQWHRPESGWSVNAGRQLVSAISSVGALDGVVLEYEGARWTTGVLSGTQPDPLTHGFSTDITQHGVFVARGSAKGSDTRWRAAVALLGAYEGGIVHREHAALQARWHRSRIYATALQEVDFYRKPVAGQVSAVSLTSSFCTARLGITESFTVNGGFDARRSLPLYRDTVTPETEFDDSSRRGYWTGVSYRPHPAASLSVDGRRSTGGPGGSANSATARIRLSQPRWSGVAVSSRHTLYDNERALGQLQSVSTGIDVGRWMRLEGTWGTRREQAADATSTSGESSNDATWWSMQVEAHVSTGWYVLGDVEHSAGDREDATLYFLSAIRRFQ